jgi:pimeloyl-ACP methyl ester carboxylesterase
VPRRGYAPGVERRTVTANGVELAYLSEGPDDGPLALCLHGFPDTAHTWRHLLPRLAGAGYRAVAPFLRGYAPSGLAPDGRYDTGTLALDACALHEALGGGDDAVIIGHDWGAFATYGAAASDPGRWRRVVTAAVAPQAAMAEGFFSYDQLRRSWYVFFFQTPLAEHAVSLDGYRFVDRLWADWSPGYDASWDVARVKEAIGTPEHLAAAIGYYRAMFAGPPDEPAAAAAQAAASSVAPQPTLYLHGADDGCIGVDAIGPVTDHLAEGSEVVVVEGAGHFLHVERPDEVGDRIIDFLGR